MYTKQAVVGEIDHLVKCFSAVNAGCLEKHGVGTDVLLLAQCAVARLVLHTSVFSAVKELMIFFSMSHKSTAHSIVTYR